MSRQDAHRLLIAYDVDDDRRRTRLSNMLKSYGDRIQYSVFIIDCAATRRLDLENDLQILMDPECDSVLICDVGKVASLNDSVFKTLGISRQLTESESFII
ncbi:MAG: CRISPR-associated endonuclease Cas2 [Ancrocorticia sp.]|uniref:CRISPR-associated endonuclease Cas2 n=1 Tax=Ancrocorticia sp. TaxID=2593684 RepID=UPI003F92A3D2